MVASDAVLRAALIGGLMLALPLYAAEAAVPAPKVHIAKNEQLPTPLPLPYDEKADAKAVDASVDAAFARAAKSGKRVLLDLGGNWCPWCRILAGVMELPEVKPFIAAHYEVVSIDVSSINGKTDRNLQILARFKTAKVDGYPWLIVAQPDGKVLASSYEVTDDNHQTPQTMVNWLARWAK